MVGYGENGSVIGPQNLPTSSVASGVWSLGEVAEASRDSIWPQPFNPESYVAIATFSGSSASSISFTSIPTKWSTLRVRVASNTDVTSNQNNVVTLNSNANGPYNGDYSNAYSNTVNLNNAAALSTEWWPYSANFPNKGANPNNFPNSGEYWFPNANSTTFYKSGLFYGQSKATTTYTATASDGGVVIAGYTAELTAATTTITMARYSGNWIDYTITLFGTCDL